MPPAPFPPPVDDAELLQHLSSLRGILGDGAGYILRSGFHVRGACLDPAWHSLRHAWQGDHAFHRLYPALEESDIPFAENCVGDQFFIREGVVWLLDAETGEIEPAEFDGLPDSSLLETAILESFRREFGELQPGQLIHVYPPLCTKESADGVALRAIDACELHRFHADFARQIADVPDGGEISVAVKRDL